MSNPHVEVGTWWKEIHDGDVRQVTDVHAHGVHLACNECGVGELFRWSQFTPFWELAPGPKEQADLESIIRQQIVQIEAKRSDKSLDMHRWGLLTAQADILRELLKEAGLE